MHKNNVLIVSSILFIHAGLSVITHRQACELSLLLFSVPIQRSIRKYEKSVL